MRHSDIRQGFPPLTSFAVASLVAHALVLALWTHTMPQIGNTDLPASLSVRIIDAPPPPNTPPTPWAATPRPLPQASQTQEPTPAPTMPAAVPATAPAMPAQATDQASMPSAIAVVVATPGPALILANVRHHLADQFRYPLLAQRRGWEGEVLLGFKVGTDGLLREIHVARGSGHPLLDRSALESLQRVRRLDIIPGAALELQLPVIYQLREG